MKKIINFSIIVLLTLFFVFSNFYYHKCKERYKKIFKEYSTHVDVLSTHTDIFNDYAEVYNSFFRKNFQYPKNNKNLGEFIKKDTINSKYYTYFLHDPFSKSNANLLYSPLYSKVSYKPEGIILISAGIDGKINTKLKDTLFIDDVKKIKFYNNVNDPTKYYLLDFDTTFSFFNCLFGNRDLLVYYKDGVGCYLGNNSNYSLSKFYNFIKHGKSVKMYLTLTGKALFVKNDTIVLSDKDISAQCLMYKGRKNTIQQGDSIRLVCDYKGKYDSVNKIVYLNNCIRLENQ